MKIIAFVSKDERGFIESKTKKIKFCTSYEEIRNEIAASKKLKKNRPQFVISALWAYLHEDVRKIVYENKDITFMFYAEGDVFSQEPDGYIRSPNMVNELVNLSELLEISSGTLSFGLSKEPYYPGELVLKKV